MVLQTNNDDFHGQQVYSDTYELIIWNLRMKYTYISQTCNVLH